MKIGVIGTGNMGRTFGVRWARAGHEVLFGSRDAAKARAVAQSAGHTARAGDFDAAAEFGEVVFYTVRGVFPSTLLRNPRALDGKIVVDCNNRDVGSRPSEFRFDAPPPNPSLTEQLAADAPGARVVKAFSTIPAPVAELPREKLAPQRVSVFVCSNDADAKATVMRLAEDLGFVGVDSGTLEHSRLVDGAADFIRLHIGPLGAGPFATLSVHVLPNAQLR